MTWNEYNLTLAPLINEFGASHYPPETIRASFYYWKQKPKEDLFALVSEAIHTKQPISLSSKPTDDYFSRLLKVNNASSALELFKNYKTLKTL